jgi:hypothetical protein
VPSPFHCVESPSPSTTIAFLFGSMIAVPRITRQRDCHHEPGYSWTDWLGGTEVLDSVPDKRGGLNGSTQH